MILSSRSTLLSLAGIGIGFLLIMVSVLGLFFLPPPPIPESGIPVHDYRHPTGFMPELYLISGFIVSSLSIAHAMGRKSIH